VAFLWAFAEFSAVTSLTAELIIHRLTNRIFIMWICQKCKEESEDTFDSCWSCGTPRDGSASAEPPPERSSTVSKSSPPPQNAPKPSKSDRRVGKYEYKVVPFIGRLKSGLFGSVEDAGMVSTQLESVINQHAGQGWEFVGLNDVNIEIKPGCLAGLFGSKTAFMPFDQVIFRRLND